MTVRSLNLVLKTLNTPPTTHDEGIIGSYHSDDIDPLCCKFTVLLEIWGQVLCVAGGLRGGET